MRCIPCIEHNLPYGTKRLKSSEIIEKICDFMSIEMKYVLSKDRHQHLAKCRMIIAYVLKRDRYLNMSLKSIGYAIGKRDHTTVIHAIKTIEAHMEVYPDFREIIKEVFVKVYDSDAYFPDCYKYREMLKAV